LDLEKGNHFNSSNQQKPRKRRNESETNKYKWRWRDKLGQKAGRILWKHFDLRSNFHRLKDGQEIALQRLNLKAFKNERLMKYELENLRIQEKQIEEEEFKNVNGRDYMMIMFVHFEPDNWKLGKRTECLVNKFLSISQLKQKIFEKIVLDENQENGNEISNLDIQMDDIVIAKPLPGAPLFPSSLINSSPLDRYLFNIATSNWDVLDYNLITASPWYLVDGDILVWKNKRLKDREDTSLYLKLQQHQAKEVSLRIYTPQEQHQQQSKSD